MCGGSGEMSVRGEEPGSLGTRGRRKPAHKAGGGGTKVTKLVRAPQESTKVVKSCQVDCNGLGLTPSRSKG